MRLIVGMTGATGAQLGIRLLELLAKMPDVDTHLVLSRWARTTIELETGMSVAEVGSSRMSFMAPRTKVRRSHRARFAPTEW